MDIALLIEQHGHRTGFTENQCCAYPNSIRPPVSYNCCFDRISSLLLIIVILPFVSSFLMRYIISLFNVSYYCNYPFSLLLRRTMNDYDYCVPMANICVPLRQLGSEEGPSAHDDVKYLVLSPEIAIGWDLCCESLLLWSHLGDSRISVIISVHHLQVARKYVKTNIRE